MLEDGMDEWCHGAGRNICWPYAQVRVRAQQVGGDDCLGGAPPGPQPGPAAAPGIVRWGAAGDRTGPAGCARRRSRTAALQAHRGRPPAAATQAGGTPGNEDIRILTMRL